MDLRAERRAALEAAHKIAQKAVTEGRGLTEQENTEIAAHEARAAEIKVKLDAQKAAEDRATALATAIGEIPVAPATQARGTGDGTAVEFNEVQPYQSEERKYQRGDAFGALVRARMQFGNDETRARAWAAKTYGENSPQSRTMQASSFTSGGAMIGGNFVGSELIELLRATAAVRRAGARSIQLVGGTATLPKITGGATAYWGDENDNITNSELTTGSVKLAEKKLTCLVPFSNDLVKNTVGLSVDRLIRDDMVRAAANTEDIGFLKGTGLSGQPKGIYYWVGSTRRSNSTGSTLANVRTDVQIALNSLGNANAPLVNRAWFMHSRSVNYIGWSLVDGNSNFAFPEVRVPANPTFAGAALFPDNNISIALGGSTQTEQYYVEMSECFIGDSDQIEIEVFANAAYYDGSTVRSGVSRDESVVRLIRKVDFAMRHAESGYVFEAVTY